MHLFKQCQHLDANIQWRTLARTARSSPAPLPFPPPPLFLLLG